MLRHSTLICVFASLLLVAGCSDDSGGTQDSGVTADQGGQTDLQLTADSTAPDQLLSPDQGGADLAITPDSAVVDSGAADTAATDTAATDTTATDTTATDTTATDAAVSDAAVSDAAVSVGDSLVTGDGGSTTCSTVTTVELVEIATGSTDYVVIGNTGSSPADISGYTLEMHGINKETFTFASGTSIPAGGQVYVFEYSSGTQTGDINTGNNIPFYNDLSSNAAMIWDASNALVDYVSIGDQVVGLPPGISATNAPWPPTYDDATQGFHRDQSSTCPTFLGSDWSVRALSRP